MSNTPSIVIERQQAQNILACVACGAEVEAACACHKPYKPAKVRVAEYDLANPGKSTRTAAADLGLSREKLMTYSFRRFCLAFLLGQAPAQLQLRSAPI